jgi:hypothetical protein
VSWSYRPLQPGETGQTYVRFVHGPYSKGWRWGVEYEIMSMPRGTYRKVCVPLWCPFLLAAAGAGLLWANARRASRAKGAVPCWSCGYDRRGIAQGGVCPECGTVPG